LDRKGDSQPCDVLLVGEYMQASIGALFDAIKKGASTSNAEVAIIPQGHLDAEVRYTWIFIRPSRSIP
jgi:type III restriction enzyme